MFEEQGQALDVRVGGQLIFNTISPFMKATLAFSEFMKALHYRGG